MNKPQYHLIELTENVLIEIENRLKTVQETVRVIKQQSKDSLPVEAGVSDDFGEPEIKQIDFDKWLADQKFYSESEGTPIDKYILENYFDSIEQFIKSPMSKAAKGVFEVATQVIKKYLSQNSR